MAGFANPAPSMDALPKAVVPSIRCRIGWAGAHILVSEHWLLFDIGNTHTVVGLFRAEGERVAEVRFRTDPQCTADEYRSEVRQLFFEQLGSNVWELAALPDVAYPDARRQRPENLEEALGVRWPI